MTDLDMVRARLGSMVRVVGRLQRTDIWVLLLAAVATIGIAVELRLKSAARSYEQTSLSSSPLQFQRQLLSGADATGQWAFIVLDSAIEATCDEARARHTKRTVLATAVISPTPGGGTAWCERGDPAIAGAPARPDLKIVRLAMGTAGARSVLVEASGRVIYSSRDRVLPRSIADLFPALAVGREDLPR